MVTVRRAASPVWFLVSVVLLCMVEYWIIVQPEFGAHDVLALAVTLDIVLGIPLLGYLLLVRTKHVSSIILAPLLLAAVVIANILLPNDQEQYLRSVEQALVLAELAALAFGMSRLQRIVRTYRAVRPQTIDATDAIALSLRQTMGDSRFVDLLTTELLLVGHAFGGWFTRYRTTAADHQAFSIHQRSGYGMILGALVGLSVVEVVITHLLLHGWSPAVAWVVTGLSVYGIFWLMGDFQAVRLHPIVLTPGVLHLRTGMRWRVSVPLTDIHLLRKANAADESPSRRNRDLLNMAAIGAPEYVLELKESVTVKGLFGMQRVAWRLGLTVDDPAAFTGALRALGVVVAG